jgi:CRP/FNR family transcriptional regulator, anaerobic regulatory protein
MDLIATKVGELKDRPGNGLNVTLSAKTRSNENWPEIRARSFATQGECAAIRNLLSREEQRQLHSITTMIDLPRGGISLYWQGEEARSIYFIDQGIIRISRCGENGKRQILEFKRAGDLLGLPDGGRYANSAETVCASRVFRCPWQQVRQIMLAEPQLQLNLLTKVADQVRQGQRRIMMLGQQNICQRLASFLLDFVTSPEFFDERRACLNLPVNRLDLADYLGTAPESTARAFAKLESDGLIKRVNSRAIKILDRKGLQQLQAGRRRAQSQAVPEQPQAV